MSENHDPSRSRRKQGAAKRLADDLADFDTQATPIPRADNEMLSLMVDEALKGVDIASRYPTFYRKLLSNTELRQAFIDALESRETEKEGELVALPQAAEPGIAFLTRLPVLPFIKILDKNSWQIAWQRSVEQLQAIFFPPKLAVSREVDLLESSWFTLLREDINVEGCIYSVLLECGLSEEGEGVLVAFLNVAVTLESSKPTSQFPISVTLQWGKYRETIQLAEQGRVRFPDIPFAMAVDDNLQKITSEMDLILEKGP